VASGVAVTTPVVMMSRSCTAVPYRRPIGRGNATGRL
jgi:hypothetical protein